jgi:hypothetical protein
LRRKPAGSVTSADSAAGYWPDHVPATFAADQNFPSSVRPQTRLQPRIKRTLQRTPALQGKG